MKVRVTLWCDVEARQGISARLGRPGRASHTEVLAEVYTLWEAHCQDLADERRLRAEAEGETPDDPNPAAED